MRYPLELSVDVRHIAYDGITHVFTFEGRLYVNDVRTSCVSTLQLSEAPVRYGNISTINEALVHEVSKTLAKALDKLGETNG